MSARARVSVVSPLDIPKELTSGSFQSEEGCAVLAVVKCEAGGLWGRISRTSVDGATLARRAW